MDAGTRKGGMGGGKSEGKAQQRQAKSSPSQITPRTADKTRPRCGAKKERTLQNCQHEVRGWGEESLKALSNNRHRNPMQKIALLHTPNPCTTTTTTTKAKHHNHQRHQRHRYSPFFAPARNRKKLAKTEGEK